MRLAFAVVSILLACMAAPASAQTAGCALVPDDRNPPEQILRCKSGLEVHIAAGTLHSQPEPQGQGGPAAIELGFGAMLLKLDTKGRPRNFQIRTPHAIAAVRGTRWAMQVEFGRTSCLVLSGVVKVYREGDTKGVLVHRGEGVDVSFGSEPLTVKRWSSERVRALMARFGR